MVYAKVDDKPSESAKPPVGNADEVSGLTEKKGNTRTQ